MLTTNYCLQLTRSSGINQEPKPVIQMMRKLLYDVPAVGTWVTISAQDEEWMNFDVKVTAHRRISDATLMIDLIDRYDRPETRGLALLRAEEILKNATPAWTPF